MARDTGGPVAAPQGDKTTVKQEVASGQVEVKKEGRKRRWDEVADGGDVKPGVIPGSGVAAGLGLVAGNGHQVVGGATVPTDLLAGLAAGLKAPAFVLGGSKAGPAAASAPGMAVGPGTAGGSAGAGAGAKKPNFSLDALAKAKAMLQKQKELGEKLKKLPQLAKAGVPAAPKSTIPLPAAAAVPATGSLQIPGLAAGLTAAPNLEAIQRAQAMAASFSLPGLIPGIVPGILPGLPLGGLPGVAASVAGEKPGKAPVLRLDALGREVDEHGKVIEKKKGPVSTLKVNLNKAKREAFRIVKLEEVEAAQEASSHFDPALGTSSSKLVRQKRSTFQFVEEGKWARQAEMDRLKAQFGAARAVQMKARQEAEKRLRAEEAAAMINPNLVDLGQRVPWGAREQLQVDAIPEVEWWDAPLLPNGTYDDVLGDELQLRMEKITIYVEHPVPIEPPAEAPPPPPQPLKLTKKEQKKLRTQRRVAREKERQEMVRQGLVEPPKSKIKLSNLMKVLGSEAVQDPTKMEKEVREAAAERERAHMDRNLARKLTPAEKREKKERKLFEEPNASAETHVAVFKLTHLNQPQTRFKVDINAQQNRLTGCILISDEMALVIAEGVSKAIRRYEKLMTRRINWSAVREVAAEAAAIGALPLPKEEEDEEGGGGRPSHCQLVWEGVVAKPNFKKFTVERFRTAAAARKFLADFTVGHYWDLASNFPAD